MSFEHEGVFSSFGTGLTRPFSLLTGFGIDTSLASFVELTTLNAAGDYEGLSEVNLDATAANILDLPALANLHANLLWTASERSSIPIILNFTEVVIDNAFLPKERLRHP